MGVRARVRSLFEAVRERDRFEAEMAEEFALHLEMRTADLVKAGLSPEAAARQARLEFGGIDNYKEQGRESRGLRWLEDARNDAAYALRMLRRNPAFAGVAVLTLALGIGANATIFGLAQKVLLRPIAVAELDRLYVVRGDIPSLDLAGTQLSPVEALDLSQTGYFDGVTAYSTGDRTITLDGVEPVRAVATTTIGDFADVFDARPLLGRMYGPAQSEPGTGKEVVLSHALWQQIGGGDPSFIGRSIDVNGVPHEVIGVLPPSFAMPRRAEMWLPFELTERWRTDELRGSLFMTTVVKAPPTMGAAGVRDRLDVLVSVWGERFGWTADAPGRVLHATPLVEYLSGPLRNVMLVLVAAVVFVLLIAAANIASLQLVRTLGRSREIAIRRALGASRGRVARQVLIEGSVLGVVGLVTGLVLGAVILRLLSAWDAAADMNLADARLDGPVIAATLVLALIATGAFALIPALRAARTEPQSALRATQQAASGAPQRHRLLKAALVTQVALALVLLLGSILMVRTLGELVAIDPGFEADGVMTAQVSIPGARYNNAEQALGFFDGLLGRVRSLPGVEDAALVWGLPFSGQGDSSPFDIPDRPRAPGEPERHAEARMVSDGYFRTMRIPLLRGSDFDGSEGPGTPLVAVIDRTFAEQFFPGEDPVGRRIRSYFGDVATIIGVVERVDHDELGDDAPKAVAYYSYRHQYWSGSRTIVVRSAAPEAAIAGALRNVVTELDRAVPAYDILPMEARIEASLGPRRLAAVTLFGFAGLALLLAACGVYGVMRYTTDLRRRELGVRLAVGAQPRRLVAMVVRQGVGIAVVGVAIGLFAAYALTRFMSSLLYGVEPQDPATFVVGVAVLLGAAGIASWLPARRAARIDPMLTLRAD